MIHWDSLYNSACLSKKERVHCLIRPHIRINVCELEQDVISNNYYRASRA